MPFEKPRRTLSFSFISCLLFHFRRYWLALLCNLSTGVIRFCGWYALKRWLSPTVSWCSQAGRHTQADKHLNLKKLIQNEDCIHYVTRQRGALCALNCCRFHISWTGEVSHISDSWSGTSVVAEGMQVKNDWIILCRVFAMYSKYRDVICILKTRY